MGKVFSVAKGIDHQGVDSFQFVYFCVGYGFAVCDVSEVAYAETYDWQRAVHYFYRSDFHTLYIERRGFDFMDIKGGDTGIFFIPETIVKAFFQIFHHVVSCI